MREARERRDGTRAWDAYTPYELRTVGALVRLGRKDEAHEMLAFFLKDRRPAAWNGWAEVVGRDPRAPRFVGDMPHTWVGTDFIRSFLDFFAIERGDGDARGASLLLGAGLPEEWVRAPGGAGVEGLRTIYGPLNLSVSASGDEVRARIAGVRVPAGRPRPRVAARRRPARRDRERKAGRSPGRGDPRERSSRRGRRSPMTRRLPPEPAPTATSRKTAGNTSSPTRGRRARGPTSSRTRAPGSS